MKVKTIEIVVLRVYYDETMVGICNLYNKNGLNML